MAEVLLDRILERQAAITSEEAESLLRVFGNTLDDLARVAVPAMGYPDFLRGGRRSPFALLGRVSADRRGALLEELC